jgi:hypothetical protein
MHYLVSFDFATGVVHLSLYRYMNLETYLDYDFTFAVPPYPTLAGTGTTVQLTVGSFPCTLATSRTWAGAIKDIFFIPGYVYGDYTPQHLYLLRYGGLTEVLAYYPAYEMAGDTLSDIINGNDGNLGISQDYPPLTTDVMNPSRTTDLYSKLPLLSFNQIYSIVFPYMGGIGRSDARFFVSFWLYGAISASINNNWMLLTFTNA